MRITDIFDFGQSCNLRWRIRTDGQNTNERRLRLGFFPSLFQIQNARFSVLRSQGICKNIFLTRWLQFRYFSSINYPWYIFVIVTTCDPDSKIWPAKVCGTRPEIYYNHRVYLLPRAYLSRTKYAILSRFVLSKSYRKTTLGKHRKNGVERVRFSLTLFKRFENTDNLLSSTKFNHVISNIHRNGFGATAFKSNDAPPFNINHN